MKIPLLNALYFGPSGVGMIYIYSFWVLSVRVAVGKSNWWWGWLRMGEGEVDMSVMVMELTVGFSPEEEVEGGRRGQLGVGMS
ncbi:hypothetical protein Pyn_40110 [Prunus yedoensis var. nudiflora]|uniref:Transmembrane protein n=1 Tax=Prunus yedoensis var. nudiflora TaxID=2094558 RepID=A0A314UPJ7_PRUYE|nr:hypothetical protein Pyn_40110 [Prunus yedoensis var. nudiflora]